jgi:DsbC/DsbD-like thiol-disulfide interchange protein/cytochrome c biogenesis protein CcdA/thiol-disulfide isomerase/thioredoxin
MLVKISIKLLFLAVFMAVFQPQANVVAGEILKHEASHSNIRISLERDALVAGKTNWLAIEITPRAGWHTYWKNPGDSGAAPIFSWSAATGGLEFGTPLYGAPQRIPLEHLMNYGYQGASTILVPVKTREDPDASLSTYDVTLAAEWLVCDVECVPQVANWTISFPIAVQAANSGDVRAVFSQARSKIPEDSYWDSTLEIADVSSELTILADKSELEGLKAAYFFPDEDGIAKYASDQVWTFTDAGLLVRMAKPRSGPAPEVADGLLQLDFEAAPSQFFSLSPTLSFAEQGKSVTLGRSADMPLWQAAIYAFVGGLILNLMPCVFPILSLKAFAFVAANYKTAENRRKEGWAYTFGIWISFMAIVAALMAFRAGGAAIGWGFQLQEPLFVGLLAILMVLVALALAGLFTIQLGIEGAGQGLATREGAQGAFFKGVLATLVATPCTAPLMAPAIGFALTQPAPTVFAVFSLLALGLALPFLLLSYSERLAAMMPRPGPWMEKVKQGLAFPMLLTAAWLIYIFDLQAGAEATLTLLFSVVMIAFAVWLWGQSTGKIARGISVLILVGVVTALSQNAVTSKRTAGSSLEAGEQPFSEAKLESLLDEGKPVFVYFTAEWCITCKVNERLALRRDETQAAFKAKGVQVLKADWTNRNDEIAKVLASYGRAGVPLYLYFPPGKREAIVLPEIITASSITDIL